MKYNVIQDLFELSQKTDVIIEKSVASILIEVRFFEEAKNKIQEILAGNFSKKKSSHKNIGENLGGLRLKLENSVDPFLQYRSHIHAKNENKNFKILNTNACNSETLSSSEIDKHIPVSSCNISESNTIRQRKIDHVNHDSKLGISSIDLGEKDSGNEKNSSATGTATSTDLNKPKYNESFSEKCSSIEEKNVISFTPNLKPPMKADGKTYVCKENKLKKVFNDDEIERANTNERFTRSKKSHENIFNAIVSEKCVSNVNLCSGNFSMERSSTEERDLISFTPNFKMPTNKNGKTYTCKKNKFKKLFLNGDELENAGVAATNERFKRSKKSYESIINAAVPETCNNNENLPIGKLSRVCSPIEEIDLISFTPNIKISKNVTGETYICKKNKIKKISFDDKIENATVTTNVPFTRSKEAYDSVTNATIPETCSNDTNLRSTNEVIMNKVHPNSCDFSKENANAIPKSNGEIVSYDTLKIGQSEVNKCPKRGKRKKVIKELLKNREMSNKHNKLRCTLDEEIEILNIKRKKVIKSDILNKSHFFLEANDVELTDLEFENASSDGQSTSRCQTDSLKANDSVYHSQSTKTKFSKIKTSSSSSARESDKTEEKSKMIKGKRLKEKKYLSKECRKTLMGGNLGKIHKPQRQVRTKSVPACHKQLVNRKFGSQTPVESVPNFNRQSLKDMVEEKRKQREIRVKKTKERRERLEKEREERIRLSEQRLKQRFQQHEEMLKQKTAKFKIKSLNRQQSSTKRNLPSTSSKDSKEDREDDNDDLCRNAEDSGQKLSKESNGYHDVSFKKVGLTSLEGSVGLYPEISKEHKSILVGCKETPVEFVVSCNRTELKKAENIMGNQDVSRLEEFKDSVSECVEQYAVSHPESKHVKHSKDTVSKGENDCSKMIKSNFHRSCTKQSKQSFSNICNTNTKTPVLRKREHVKECSKQSSSLKVSGKNRNSYLLRSAKKNYPNKIDENCSPNTSIYTAQNQHQSKNLESPKIKSTYSGNSNKSTMCLNCSKTLKTKNILKIPYKTKLLKNAGSLPPKCSKHDAKDSSHKIKKNNKSRIPLSKKQVVIKDDSDFTDDSLDESYLVPKEIPLWATGVYLKQALIYQHYNPPNLDELFGIIPNEPVDLVAMFGKNKPHYHKRTSSENWNVNITPT